MPRSSRRSEKQAVERSEADWEELARQVALRQLNAAPRSRAQLADKLAAKEIPEVIAARILDRFTEVGLIDDAAYAGMLVRTRHAERGLSRRALALELRRKGIDDEVAETALAQVEPEDEDAAARQVAAKKARATTGLDYEVRKRRIAATLGRKGYPPGVCFRVTESVLQDEAADSDGALHTE